jgi:ABC-2 type transport system permease protein
MNRVTTMKWLEIVRFELVYQLRRRSTWLIFALFLFPLIGVTNDALIDARNREILFHAPLFIAESSVIMSLIALLVLAGVAGDAATRDVQTRLEPLMHAAPISPAAYVGGRFLGAFAVAAILLAVVPLVRMLLPLFHPGLEAEIVGPFRPAAYLQAYFLLIVPNAFVATALMFALATLVRHTLGSYVGAALVFAGAQFSGDFVGGTLGRWDLAKMLDSTGVIALEVMTRTWSPVEVNERLIGSEGALLWNRLLWLAIAFAVLVLTYRRFHFGANAGEVRWWQRGRLRVAGLAGRPAAGAGAGGFEGAVAERSAPVAVPRVPREFGAAGRVRQTLTIARDSLREVATGWSWLVLPFLLLRIALILGELNTMGAGTPVLPTTGRVLGPFDDMPPPIEILMFMLPVLFAGEVVWRERDANMQALADAAPVPDGVRFVGKLLGLWLIIVAFHGLLMLAGVVSQVVRGWYDFDFALYFQILFGLELVDPLVFGLLALSVHVLVNQKHVGHLVVLLLIIGLNGFAPLLGIEHPLLLYGSEPGWRHSPISGFGPFVGPVLWFELYWAAWTLLLALVARLFWVRGVERGMGERVRIARRRFTGQTVGAVAAALGLVLLVGGFIFYNTNILNAYDRTADGTQRQAEYERLYGRYEGAPQPQMTATELDVEIYPDRREADVRGVHHLVNRTAAPIDTIHVAVSSQVETGEIEFGRPARAALVDDDLGHRIYVLEEPLQPGDSLGLSWQVRHAPRGFPARGISTAVVGNGSFIVMPTWTPLIGYQPRRELSNAGQRREHGLAARPAVPSLYDLQARRDPTGQERIDLEVTVGTAADQIAVAPGERLETWAQGGRRYFHYATAAPIGNEYAIFSADYAVREARWGDVALEVFHHPAHDLNVQRMIRSMEASLEQFTERFGPYPYKVLRMVEYPAAGGSLHAAAATIWYQELFSLFDTARDPRRIDLPFAVVAHEVAHQFQPAPASVEGRALLSESFAWYAAMGVIEQEYGAEHLARFLGFMRESYLDPRSRADVPLLHATDSFLAYRKGPFAMYALREYVGQERVDLAWRRLRARHASQGPPFATSLDLYRELQEVTPDSLHDLLGDLLERNTFWEMEARQASAQQTPGGEWQVSVDVVARKVVVDTAGAEAEMPMDDLVEIGVFAPAEDGESPTRPLYRAMHRIRTGPQTITITVPGRPARAGIDPRHLLIDVEPSDNLVDIQDPSPSTD